MKAWIAAISLLVLSALPGWTEEWISLGTDKEGFELDLSSVREEGRGARSAVVRMSGSQPQGILTVHFLYVAHCGAQMLEIARGRISSSWSTRVEEMPELPERERLSHLPVPNQQLNNLCDYLCR